MNLLNIYTISVHFPVVFCGSHVLYLIYVRAPDLWCQFKVLSNDVSMKYCYASLVRKMYMSICYIYMCIVVTCRVHVDVIIVDKH